MTYIDAESPADANMNPLTVEAPAGAYIMAPKMAPIDAEVPTTTTLSTESPVSANILASTGATEEFVHLRQIFGAD